MPQASSRHSTWLTLGGIALLSVWTRLSVWREVFVAGELLTRDPDADYHLLRIQRSVEQFPRVPIFDPQLNWPEGGPCPWAPGFDLLGALFSMLMGAGPGSAPGAIERAAAFYPVVLGVALVLASFALTRQLLAGHSARSGSSRDATAAALTAAALVAVLPRAVAASSLGRVDHHVFEALAYVLLGSWALQGVRAAGAGALPGLRFELQGALLIGLAGAGFTGSILYAGLAAAILCVVQLLAPGRPRVRWLGSGAPAFAIAAAALALLYAPSVAVHGEAWDFRLASFLQPALHGLLALGCALAASLTRIGASDEPALSRLWRRAGWLAGAGLLGALATWPLLGEGIWRGLHDWIATQDPWLASIDEFQPLYRDGSWRSLLDFNGWPGLLAPLVVPVGLAVLARHDRAMAWAFGGWLLALLPLALLRTRFATPLTLPFAICGALSLLALTRALARTACGRSPARPALVSALLAVLLIGADPATRATLGPRPARSPDALESVTLHLRGLPDPGSARGTLALWSQGHTVLRLARRPVLTAGFGHWTGLEGFQASETFMQRSVPELMQLMDERQLGFLITGMSAPFPAPGDRWGDPDKPFVLQGERVVWNAPYFRALPLMPLIVGGSGDPELEIPHVPTLMPQFASAQGASEMGFPLQRLWLYERVAGARLVGNAAPGAVVVAETPLLVRDQRSLYRAWTRADPQGRFELVLPLPTGRQVPGLRSGPRVRVSSQGRELARLVVDEGAVRSGQRIEVAASSPATATPLARR